MNIIYLIYRAERETEQEDLNKFINVMGLAGFDPLLIKLVSYEEYLNILDTEIPSFAIAINDTYKDLSGVYSDKLKVSVFDFFSKEYIDIDNQVFLTGIVINSKDIFNPIYKKYVWNNFKKFYQTYLEFSSKSSGEIINNDEVADTSEVVIDDNSPEDKLELNLVVVEQDSLEESKSITVETLEMDLESFYLDVKKLVDQFNIVQEKIKHIELRRNEK